MIAESIDGIIAFLVGIWSFFYLSKSPKLQPNFQKLVKYCSPILIIIGAIFIIKPFFEKQKNNIDFQYVAKQINDAIAGTYVDEVTIIDSVTFENQNELCYYYTIVSTNLEDFDDEFKEELKNNVILNVQNNPKLNDFKQDGIIIIVRYFDVDNFLITEVRINPDDILINKNN